VKTDLRGVYLLPWYSVEGGRPIVAVDHHGRRIHEAIAYTEQDQYRLAEELWTILDRLDPISLRLLG